MDPDRVAPKEESAAPGLARIVVGIDGSKRTSAVLEAAARLPFAADASILIVHVVRWHGNSPVAHALVERRGHEILASAHSTLAGFLPDALSRPRIETVLLWGAPYVEIIRRARTERADLIVVGRHGERSFLDALIGATAERVVRKGTTPVLVVGPQSVRRYARPLVGVDYSETCARALAVALQIVDRSAAIDLIHVMEEGAEGDVAASLDAFARNSGIAQHAKVTVRSGDPRAILLEEARSRGTDLVVVGTHGRSWLAHALIGSVAEAVVRAAPCDVLVARLETHRYEHP